MNSTEILIVGAGVIGNAIAYHLALAGHQVTVLERGEIAATPSASWASAGGVRRQGRHRAEIALAVESSMRWRTLAEELGTEVGYRESGNLMLAESDAHAERVKAFVERQRRKGLTDVALLDRKQIREMVPGITPDAISGSFSPRDGQADPVLTTRAFAVAAQRHGARYLINTVCDKLILSERRVIGARTSRGEISAATTVLAAGAWTTELVATIGLNLPVRVEALQMLRSTGAPPDSLRPVLSSLGRKLSLKQTASGSFILGGGWPGDVTDDDAGYRLRSESIEGNWREACAVLPMIAQLRIERAWCGLEATSVDDLPLIGGVPQFESLLVATGFSGHGFAIAPAVGRAVADLISGKKVEEVSELRADRFDR
jgi:sarcosine oxidase subunit beta